MSFQEIDVDEFKEKMKADDAVILDVRTEAELVEGEIPGYQMINFMGADFAQQVAQLDKNKTYLIYCRSGNRSGRACEMMAGMGFTKLYNLIGGIHAWNVAQEE